MLKFGDIFFVEDKEYVWLYSDGKTIDAAIILDPETTKNIKRVQALSDRRGQSHKKFTFCYVELNTDSYIDCCAHMMGVKQPIELDSTIRPVNKSLDTCDLVDIKKEILSSADLFKESLVEHVKSISIS